jgi:hypothetical protein
VAIEDRLGRLHAHALVVAVEQLPGGHIAGSTLGRFRATYPDAQAGIGRWVERRVGTTPIAKKALL